MLFSGERAALLGASIYLFLPVTYIYAGLAELACSTIFFIVLISFHFLRFIQQKSDRDIVMVSFFIGAGFLYKYIRMLLLSLVPVFPWIMIQRYFAWRQYRIIWANLIPPDGMGYSHFAHLPIEVTWGIFILFLLSIVYLLIRERNDLTLFSILLFIAYYIFLALDQVSVSPRMLMAFCPTITIFSALMLSSIMNNLGRKYSFNAVPVIVITYLVLNNMVPSLNSAFLGQPEFIKMEDYPSENAMKWVRDNVGEGEKIVTLRIMTALYYRDKYNIDKSKIIDFWYELDEVSTPEKLLKLSRQNDVTYVMFPYGAVYDGYFPILEYLKNNRNDEFIKVKEYSIGDNFIYIYKIDGNALGTADAADVPADMESLRLEQRMPA
jgi:hypothetical protein